MKQIKTKSGEIICVEVPEDVDLSTLSYSTSQDLHLLTTDGKDVDVYCENIPDIKILGKLSELTNKDCEEFCYYFEDEDIWMNYNKTQPYIPYKDTAKESIIYLLQSEGIDTSNKDRLLIIKLL